MIQKNEINSKYVKEYIQNYTADKKKIVGPAIMIICKEIKFQLSTSTSEFLNSSYCNRLPCITSKLAFGAKQVKKERCASNKNDIQTC